MFHAQYPSLRNSHLPLSDDFHSHTTRFKRRAVQVYEAEAESIDVQNKTVTFEDKSEIKGHLGSITVPYDYLVYAVGSENQTFGIQGIREHACFLKELGDAVQIRTRLMDW